MASNPQNNRNLFKHTPTERCPRLAYDVIHLAAKETVESVDPCSCSARVCRFDATIRESSLIRILFNTVQKYPQNRV
jgi:hypothetical protein